MMAHLLGLIFAVGVGVLAERGQFLLAEKACTGVHFGYGDKMPIGIIVGRALTIKAGQTHVQKYMEELLQLVLDGKVDPSFIITHRLRLEDGPKAYEEFKNNKSEYIKVVMSPGG